MSNRRNFSPTQKLLFLFFFHFLFKFVIQTAHYKPSQERKKNKSVKTKIVLFFDAYRKKRCYFFAVKVHFKNELLNNLTLITEDYEQKDRQENKVKDFSFFFGFFLTKYTKKTSVAF